MTDQSQTFPYQQTVDQLFTWVGQSADSAAASPANPPSQDRTALPAAETPTAPADSPPPWSGLTDWQGEYQWLQEERKRLEAYTLSQFALIKQQREELLGRKSGIEEALALREQELNRQLKLLAEGAETLAKRDRELAEREAALAEQQQRLNNARQELHALQQANVQLHRDNEAQRLLAAELRLQTTHLQEAVRAARSELAALEQVLRRRKEEAEAERAELAESRRQLERRHAALEQAEEALRRRVAEVDQLEAQLRRELEQREQQLAMEYQELERARAGLRRQLQKRAELQAAVVAPSPGAVGEGRDGTSYLASAIKSRQPERPFRQRARSELGA
ncbi:MAG TPA: hypothetical protein VNK04_21865 [Gemmataceae bacterium]|nr:hypothetical protein [Gemmataceae bacterium]